MTRLEALQEAITALSNSETLSSRCAEERFTDKATKANWLDAARRAKEAREVLIDLLATVRQEASNGE